MAKINESLRLSPLEIDTIMTEESRLRIATIGPEGEINLTPMTFGWANGLVYIFGRGQKIADLRRNSTATLLVDVGSNWRDLKGVMMKGKAQVLEEQADEDASEGLKDAQLNLGKKHGLKDNGATKPYKATASGKSRRWIVFRPDSIVTWDNSKLG